MSRTRSEEERLLQRLDSVEKEERQQEERLVNTGAVRRHLFIDEHAAEPIEGNLDSDDEEEDQLFVQEEDSESEQSVGEELDLPEFEGPEYTGKDGVTKWNVHCPPRNVRTPAVNLVRCLPGVRQNLEFESPVSARRLIFTTDILDDIVTHTNQLIQKVRPNFTRERDEKDTLPEIKIGSIHWTSIHGRHSSRLTSELV